MIGSRTETVSAFYFPFLPIDSQITFEPGDVVVVYPENCEEDIKEFFRLFSFKADMYIKVTPTEEGTPLPNFLSAQVSIRECAQKYFDLTYIPKR